MWDVNFFALARDVRVLPARGVELPVTALEFIGDFLVERYGRVLVYKSGPEQEKASSTGE